MSTPGYRIAIHNALTTPILMAGVPRKFAILNGTVCAAVTFGLQSLYALPVCLMAHLVAMFLTKKDPYFFQTIIRHVKHKGYYSV